MTIADMDSCAQVFTRLDEWVDRELSAEDLEQVEQHLGLCATCASEFRIEGTLLRNLRNKVQRIHMPPEIEVRVWKRFIASACDDAQA